MVYSVERRDLRVIDLPRADVLRISNRLRAAIVQGRDTDAQRWAKGIYLEVFGIDDALLRDVDHLVTIADGTWQTVPFAALQDSSGSPLIQRVRVSAGLSATVWARRTPTNPIARPAVSVFSASKPNRPGLAALPAVNAEGRVIREIYGVNSLPLTRTDEFMAALKDSDIVHFGGHAVPDELQPWNSRLIFDSSYAISQRITSVDIESVKARASLVVLAACRTADGPPSRGEGLLTLARSFVSAGVHAVVATQWDVDDSGTAELITDFHRFYRKSADASDSLRQAQLQAISQRRPMRSWAAFLVIGE